MDNLSPRSKFVQGQKLIARDLKQGILPWLDTDKPDHAYGEGFEKDLLKYLNEEYKKDRESKKIDKKMVWEETKKKYPKVWPSQGETNIPPPKEFFKFDSGSTKKYKKDESLEKAVNYLVYPKDSKDFKVDDFNSLLDELDELETQGEKIGDNYFFFTKDKKIDQQKAGRYRHLISSLGEIKSQINEIGWGKSSSVNNFIDNKKTLGGCDGFYCYENALMNLQANRARSSTPQKRRPFQVYSDEIKKKLPVGDLYKNIFAKNQTIVPTGEGLGGKEFDPYNTLDIPKNQVWYDESSGPEGHTMLADESGKKNDSLWRSLQAPLLDSIKTDNPDAKKLVNFNAVGYKPNTISISNRFVNK